MIKLDKSWFPKIDALMQEAFPYEERRIPQEQLELFDDPDYAVYGMVEQDHLLAFLAVWNCDTFCFGEHLAVDKDLRGSGIGKQLLLEYLNYDPRSFYLEVEHPETEIAKRRIGFYQRLQFYLHDDIEYYQYPFHEECDLFPLHLMSHRRNEDDALSEIIQTIYKKVYRQQDVSWL